MSYHNLGNVHSDLGDFQEAKQYHEKALAINTEQLGSNHVDVAMSYSNLGSVHILLGNIRHAKQYCEMALAIRTEQLGPKRVQQSRQYEKSQRFQTKLLEFTHAGEIGRSSQFKCKSVGKSLWDSAIFL